MLRTKPDDAAHLIYCELKHDYQGRYVDMYVCILHMTQLILVYAIMKQIFLVASVHLRDCVIKMISRDQGGIVISPCVVRTTPSHSLIDILDNAHFALRRHESSQTQGHVSHP